MVSFSHDLAARMIRLRNNTISDQNMDQWRFPSSVSWYQDDKHLLDTLDHVLNSPDAYDNAASLYWDNQSRDLLSLLFCFRALGPSHVMLPSNTKNYWKNYEIAASWRKGPGEREVPPFEFSLYQAQFMDTPIELECWLGNAVFSFLVEQYFLNRRGITVKPSPGDYVIDAGGCFGDTALAFSVAIGESGRVFSFEPLPRLKEIFVSNLRRNVDLARRIELFEYAVWDVSRHTLNFSDFGAGSRQDRNGEIQVATITIDDFVVARRLPRVDFIKMDIEGAEREALRGAADTIRRFKPRLAISAYHRLDDLLVLPAMIKEIEPSYELILDHYTIHSEESVIYATV